MSHQTLTLITLVLAAAPALFHLPLWVACIAVIGGASHYGGNWRKGWLAKGLSSLLIALTIVGIWFDFDSWFSGDAVLAFFIAVVFLKWGEAKVRRDYLLLIFAAVILSALGALYWETLLSVIHMFFVVMALLVSLIVITSGDDSAQTVLLAFKQAVVLFLLGLPIMILMFLTVPRIPSPIGDIGLAFGLPIKAMLDQGKGDHGKKMMVLKPGGVSRAKKENDSVLVAEFEGPPPFKSRLYWRGPVYWDYDGENWTLPENWDNRNTLLSSAIRSKAKLDYELRSRGTPVSYTLRVMPNGGRWLYGLDVPAAPAPEAFISKDFQLLSIRKLNDKEPKFQMLSYLDYSVGSHLSEQDRKRSLAWPENSNPRLQALGQKLAAEHDSTKEIIRQGLEILATGNYTFNSAYIITPGQDMFDRFFFDEKKGGSEYLAGSFTMLMRAAGVPARLVAGYRGGTIIALTKFVIVKQTNAHAWLEVWQDDKGWSRVETKDIVLPPGEKDKSLQQQQTSPQMAVEIKKTEKAVETDKPATEKKAEAAVKPTSAETKSILPDFSGLFAGLQKWVIDYNPDRQVELLAGIGATESDWQKLFGSGVVGVIILLGAYLGIAQYQNRKQVDHVSKEWQSFCAQMMKLGVTRKAHECPRDFRERVRRELPEYTEAGEDIINRYIDIRFTNKDSSEARQHFCTQVKRFVSMT